MDVDLNSPANVGVDEGLSLGSDCLDREKENLNPMLSEEVKALEQLLSVGSVIDTVEAAHALYCNYAHVVGFSVKKGTQAYFNNTLIIRMKAFHCSCEGFAEERRSKARLLKHRKFVSRCSCRARLRVLRDDAEGPFNVSVFVTEYNHEMLPPDYTYLLRSARNLTLAQRSMFEVFHSRGIGVSKAFASMENEAGGVQNVGFMPRDAYLHIKKVNRKSLIGDGDADALLKFFRDKNNTDAFFYWNYQRDDDGRLMNFFYRDESSLRDYEQFGDVMLVDATYRTNKYNLICAPFVGLNHHRSNVIFGMGFLSDETTETFEWLFCTFLESMKGKEPGVIFTDQGQALVNGINNIFMSATHRLCQWHIYQKTPIRFGKMNKDKAFKRLWHTCMNGCETVAEFEQQWGRMMEHESKIDSRWFKKMYQLRRKWASIFTLGKFTAGIHATSRSECSNKVLKQYCSSSSTLISFVTKYEDLLKAWHHKEGEFEAVGVWVPGQILPDCRMLSFASSIYTRSVFKLFEKQAGFSICISIKTKPIDESAEDLEYTVFSSTAASGERRVKVNLTRQEWSCSCMMWESEGIYCRHLIKILLWLNVYQIPDKHILDRWRKDARLRLFKPPKKPEPNLPTTNQDKLLWINGGMQAMYQLFQRCSDDPIKTKGLGSRIAELMKEFGSVSKEGDLQGDEEQPISDDNEGERLFKNPWKPVGAWVPGHRGKATAKPKKKPFAKKKKKPVAKATRVTQKEVQKESHNVEKISSNQPSASAATPWQMEYNIPTHSQSVFISCDRSSAFTQVRSGHQFQWGV